MKKRVLSLALLLGAGMHIAFGQGIAVKGTVVDEAGNPVAGANVETVDQKMSTFTDGEGNFEMEIPEGAQPELKITFGNMEHTVAAAEDLSRITLKKSSTSLDGVVVTGYRTITKEKYVGAADNISADHIEKMPVADVTRALEGAAPGLQFAGGGSPGSGVDIRIRGFGSVTGSSSPLFVVDGTPYAGDITSINPLDIENVTVLKDATATSLYGSRGANGVIVITTKRGRSKNNAATINVDIRSGLVQRGIPNYDVMTSESEYYETSWRALYHMLRFNTDSGGFSVDEAKEIASGLSPGDPGVIERLGGYNSYDVPNDQVVGIDGKINPNANLKYHDVWDDEITRRGIRNEINLNVGNSDEKNDYYFSLGYLDEQGFIKYTDYQRFSGRLNINSQVKDYLKMGINLSGTLGDGQFQESTVANSANPMFISKDWAPIFPVYYYNDQGQKEIDPITGKDKYDWGARSSVDELISNSSIGDRALLPGNNILGQMSMDKQYYKSMNIIAVPYIEVSFLKNFTFNTLLNYNYYDYTQVSAGNKFYGGDQPVGGRNNRSEVNQKTYTFRQMLSYNNSFDKGDLNIFAVHENYDMTYNLMQGSAQGIPVAENEHLTGAELTSADSREDVFRMESYLIGASYIHDNNLFFDASARWDGTSRFAPGSKWNTIPFWAVGVGYNLKSADFLKEIDAINNLKVKLSYGTQGNQEIGTSSNPRYYAWQSLYGVSSGGAISVLQVGNEDLTWEKTGSFNAGVEFGLFSNRLFGEINFFNKNTTDLLFLVPAPPSSGITEIPKNMGSLYNRGVEVTLGSQIIRQVDPNDFGWSVNLNVTHLRNKITEMPMDNDSMLNGMFQYKKGHSIYDFYIVEHAGVSASTGNELYYNYDSDGQRYEDSIWADVQTTGRVYHGSAIPDLFGTFVNNLDYRGFNLQFTLAFGIGGDYYDGVYAGLMQPGTFGSNWHRDIMNSWTEENPSSSLPKVEFSNVDIGGTTTRFLTDASYLNIRNISFGYTLPSKWTDKLKINNVRLYALFDNVHLFSARKGMNPQSSFNGQSGYTYTPSRTMMFGVKFNL